MKYDYNALEHMLNQFFSHGAITSYPLKTVPLPYDVMVDLYNVRGLSRQTYWMSTIELQLNNDGLRSSNPRMRCDLVITAGERPKITDFLLTYTVNAVRLETLRFQDWATLFHLSGAKQINAVQEMAYFQADSLSTLLGRFNYQSLISYIKETYHGEPADS